MRFTRPQAKSCVRHRILAVYRRHGLCRITFAGSGAGWQDGVDLPQLLRCQFDPGSAEVFFEVVEPLCSRDRHDVIPLREDPGEGELARGAIPGSRQGLDLLHKVEILLEIFALESRTVAPEVVSGEVVDRLECTREEAAA